MTAKTRRTVALTGLLLTSMLSKGCWHYHGHHHERHGERHDNHAERHDDHAERHDDHNERKH